MTETITDPMSAEGKPLTSKPSKNDAANINSKAFITKMNSPRVIIVIGRVNITKIGFTTAFKIPNTTAATVAVKTPSTSIPGTNRSIISRISATSKMREMKYIFEMVAQQYKKVCGQTADFFISMHCQYSTYFETRFQPSLSIMFSAFLYFTVSCAPFFSIVTSSFLPNANSFFLGSAVVFVDPLPSATF